MAQTLQEKYKKDRHRWDTDPAAWSARQLTSRKSHLKKKYGLTLEDWSSMLIAQNSCCAICKTHIDNCTHQQLAVDHCHATGKVRALLCDLCNTALGKFKDNPELLREAADYVERHNDSA